MIVSDECVKDNGVDWPKLVWIVNARDETQSRTHRDAAAAATIEASDKRGGRFGAHNLHEN